MQKSYSNKVWKMTDGNWPLILGVCTLLGGISAVWFFWDKVATWIWPSVVMESVTGQGGAAVRGGSGSVIDVENLDGGEIQAGLGGTGGNGGNAIVVEDGAGIKIINRGKIIGGDAGQ